MINRKRTITSSVVKTHNEVGGYIANHIPYKSCKPSCMAAKHMAHKPYCCDFGSLDVIKNEEKMEVLEV